MKITEQTALAELAGYLKELADPNIGLSDDDVTLAINMLEAP